MRGFIAVAFLVLMFLCGNASAADAPVVSPIPNLTTANFANTIKAYQNTPILVQFKADWCGYCRRLNPFLEKLYVDRFGKVLIYRVDVDQQQALSKKYRIKTLPTLIMFYKGDILARNNVKGEDLQAWVDQRIERAQQPSLWESFKKLIQ